MFRSNRFAALILVLGVAALGIFEYASAHNHPAAETAAAE